jgi:hypothetical protein
MQPKMTVKLADWWFNTSDVPSKDSWPSRGRRMAAARVIAAVALALGISPMASAGLINVQFGCTAGVSCVGAGASSTLQTGAAVIGSPGDVWNLVSGDAGLGTTGSNVPLVDATGAATSATVSWTSLLAYVTPAVDGFDSTPQANLMDGYIVNKDGTDSITISGLIAGADYSLYVISQSDVNARGRSSVFTVNGGPTLITAPTDPAASTYISGQNYGFFDTSADLSGTITILYSTNHAEADVNGFQLFTNADAAPVPEPGGIGLAIGGLAGLVGFWRRRTSR